MSWIEASIWVTEGVAQLAGVCGGGSPPYLAASLPEAYPNLPCLLAARRRLLRLHKHTSPDTKHTAACVRSSGLVCNGVSAPCQAHCEPGYNLDDQPVLPPTWRYAAPSPCCCCCCLSLSTASYCSGSAVCGGACQHAAKNTGAGGFNSASCCQHV